MKHKKNSGLFMIWAALAVSNLSCSHTATEKKSAGPGPIEIVVHRGANRLAPENTMAAMRQVIDHGADYIEIDVAESSDGVFYCFHDRTLRRTTDGEGRFEEQPS